MADLKISQLTDGGNSQAADEYVIARSGANYRIDGASVAAAATSVGTLTSLTVSGNLTVDTNTLFVDAANNRVGVGTASPSNDLDVSKSTASGSVIASVVNTSSTGAARIYLGNDGSASAGRLQIFGSSHAVRPGIMAIGTDASLPLVFDTAGAEKMRLDTSGNLGIGTTSPGNPLVVASNTTSQVSIEAVSGNNNSQLNFNPAGTGIAYIKNQKATALAFGTNNTEVMRLDASGNLGLGVTPSAWGTIKALQVFNGSIAGSPNNNILYQLGNAYYDGSAFKYIASDYAAQYRINDSGKHAWYSTASGTAGNTATFGDAKMTLDASGNLGIGTTSPGNTLSVNLIAGISGSSGSGATVPSASHVSSSTLRLGLRGSVMTSDNAGLTTVGTYLCNNVFFRNASGNPGYLTTNPASAILLTDDITIFRRAASGTANTDLAFTESARITSGGYFKASNSGTYRSSTGTFHEMKTDAAGTAFIVGNTSATCNSDIFAVTADRNTTDNTFYPIVYYNDGAGAHRFRVADSGNVTNTNNSYGAISDEKVKQDIVDAASQWDDIKGLRVRKFRYKNAPDAPLQIGLVAQEAEVVSPGLVDEAPDYEEVEVTDEDGNVTTERQATGTVTKSVKYSVLYMKSVKALQEAMARIEALEARLEALEA